MVYVDSHCDVISKLLHHPHVDIDNEAEICATVNRMQEGGALLQFYAIFISPSYPASAGFELIMQSIDLFRTRLTSDPRMQEVKNKADLDTLIPGKRIGALLTLEGVHAVPQNPMYIRLLRKLGVRAIGLTWNHANWAADGVMEARGGGLTEAGKELVQQCNVLDILIDVSHLSEQGFWDTAEASTEPLIASHSNAAEICAHPRNLNRQQIEHLIQNDGMIGLTFVPDFVRSSSDAQPSVKDLLVHIDYIGSLGGIRHIGIGSDFDGFDSPLQGIEHPAKFEALQQLLLKYYSTSDTAHILHLNWINFLKKTLPV